MRSIKTAFDRWQQQRRLWKSMRKYISQTSKKIEQLSTESERLRREAHAKNHFYAERVIDHQAWQLHFASAELTRARKAATLTKAHDHLGKSRQLIHEAEHYLQSLKPKPSSMSEPA